VEPTVCIKQRNNSHFLEMNVTERKIEQQIKLQKRGRRVDCGRVRASLYMQYSLRHSPCCLSGKIKLRIQIE
jgi:hypothetical protein